MKDKFKSVPSLAWIAAATVVAGYWVWQQSEVAGATLIIVGVMLMLTSGASIELKRFEARVCGPDDYEQTRVLSRPLRSRF